MPDQDDIVLVPSHDGSNVGGNHFRTKDSGDDGGYLGAYFPTHIVTNYDDSGFDYPNEDNTWSPHFLLYDESQTGGGKGGGNWTEYFKDLTKEFWSNEDFDDFWNFFDFDSAQTKYPDDGTADTMLTNFIGSRQYYSIEPENVPYLLELSAPNNEAVSMAHTFYYPGACINGPIYGSEHEHRAAFSMTNFSINQFVGMMDRRAMAGMMSGNYGRGPYFHNDAWNNWDNGQHNATSNTPTKIHWSMYYFNPTGGAATTVSRKRLDGFPVCTASWHETGSNVSNGRFWSTNDAVPGVGSGVSWDQQYEDALSYTVGCCSFLIDLEEPFGTSRRMRQITNMPWYASNDIAEECSTSSPSSLREFLATCSDDVEITIKCRAKYDWNYHLHNFGQAENGDMNFTHNSDEAIVLACGFPGLANDGGNILDDLELSATPDGSMGPVVPYAYVQGTRGDFSSYTNMEFNFTNGSQRDDTSVGLWDRLMCYIRHGCDVDWGGWTPRMSGNYIEYDYDDDPLWFMSENSNGSDIHPLEVLFYTPIVADVDCETPGDYEGYDGKEASEKLDTLPPASWNFGTKNAMGFWFIEDVKLFIRSKTGFQGGVN